MMNLDPATEMVSHQVNILTLCFGVRRMKKKRKRSSSSSSSTSSSRSSSSSSSSSSTRKRSKKKRKKKHRSKRRVSTRSAEGKGRKERKEEEEEEELEWFPAPPNTSATFLNQRGGPGFGAEEDGAEERGVGSLYSLPGASDDDDCVSNSSHRGRRERETGRRNSRGGSPEQAERERRDRSREAGRDRRRRSSLDGDLARRRESCSSTEHEGSRGPGSARNHQNPEGDRARQDALRRNSSDGGRYDSGGRGWTREGGSSAAGQGSRAAGNGTPAGQSGSRPKKELPANLLDIFNQIAQFEKEKGGRAKL